MKEAIRHLQNGKTVLSHCMGGRHRSSVFGIVVLACWLGRTLKEAREMYFSRRPRLTDRDHGIIEEIIGRRGIAHWVCEFQKQAAGPHTQGQSSGSSGSSGVLVCSTGSGDAARSSGGSGGSAAARSSGGSGGSATRARSRSPPPPPVAASVLFRSLCHLCLYLARQRLMCCKVQQIGRAHV